MFVVCTSQKMAPSTENFDSLSHWWLDLYTLLVWCLNFRAPFIQLFRFLYTPTIHESMKNTPLSASHTSSVQYLSAPLLP